MADETKVMIGAQVSPIFANRLKVVSALQNRPQAQLIRDVLQKYLHDMGYPVPQEPPHQSSAQHTPSKSRRNHDRR